MEVLQWRFNWCHHMHGKLKHTSCADTSCIEYITWLKKRPMPTSTRVQEVTHKMCAVGIKPVISHLFQTACSSASTVVVLLFSESSSLQQTTVITTEIDNYMLKLASVLCQNKNGCSQTAQENGLAIRDWSTGNNIDYLSYVTWGWCCYIIIF